METVNLRVRAWNIGFGSRRPDFRRGKNQYLGTAEYRYTLVKPRVLSFPLRFCPRALRWVLRTVFPLVREGGEGGRSWWPSPMVGP